MELTPPTAYQTVSANLPGSVSQIVFECPILPEMGPGAEGRPDSAAGGRSSSIPAHQPTIFDETTHQSMPLGLASHLPQAIGRESNASHRLRTAVTARKITTYEDFGRRTDGDRLEAERGRRPLPKVRPAFTPPSALPCGRRSPAKNRRSTVGAATAGRATRRPVRCPPSARPASRCERPGASPERRETIGART